MKDWIDFLREAVERTSRGQVAKEMTRAGAPISRTSISLVLNDRYPAGTDKIASRVMKIYGRVACPHLQEEISGAQCEEYHHREAPTSSPFAMRHWRACQGCEHNRRPK